MSGCYREKVRKERRKEEGRKRRRKEGGRKRRRRRKKGKEEGRREGKMEEGRCNYKRYRFLVQNKFHNVTESEALARIEVMYPNTNKDKGKQKLFR